MKGRLCGEQPYKTLFQSSDLTCEKQWLGGTSCSLRIMTQIIGSLMGSVALEDSAPQHHEGEDRGEEKRGEEDQSLPPINVP